MTAARRREATNIQITDTMAPMIPTIMRIRPTVCRSTPTDRARHRVAQDRADGDRGRVRFQGSSRRQLPRRLLIDSARDEHVRHVHRRLRDPAGAHATSATRSARSSRERVAPRAAEIDAKAEYPWDIRELFAEHDILGLPFAERVRRHRHRHADAAAWRSRRSPRPAPRAR